MKINQQNQENIREALKKWYFLGIIPKRIKMSLLPKKDGFSRPKTIKFRKT